jgi:phosphomannomutase
MRRKVEAAKPKSIAGFRVTGINRLDGFKYELEDGGWLLIRFSGTEPLVRVYCETTHEDKVDEIIVDGLSLVGIKA